MAAFHTRSDLSPGRIPESTLAQLTQDDPTLDVAVESVWEAMRARADARIRAFIGARYALPIDTSDEDTAALLSGVSIDLTLYHLYQRRYAEGVPEGVRKGYEDAISTCKQISDGVLILAVQPAPAVNDERAAQVTTHDRVFSRKSLRGL